MTGPERPRGDTAWFGWDYDGLDAEIRFIFVDHATPTAPERLEGEDGSALELEADGPRTIVRAVRPGSLAQAAWEELYDDVEEGWRTFLHQLRFYLERHAGRERRTVFLSGQAAPAAVRAALDDELSAPVWHESRHQRLVAPAGGPEALIALHAKAPLDGAEPAGLWMVVTAYGLDDAAYEAVADRWAAWWTPLVAEPQVTP